MRHVCHLQKNPSILPDIKVASDGRLTRNKEGPSKQVWLKALSPAT